MLDVCLRYGPKRQYLGAGNIFCSILKHFCCRFLRRTSLPWRWFRCSDSRALVGFVHAAGARRGLHTSNPNQAHSSVSNNNMSSNVGLSTPRGSGTSGYVQRNLSYLKPRDNIAPYSNDLGSPKHHQRQPDQAILEHDRRREVEVKVFELRDRLEDAGSVDRILFRARSLPDDD